MNLEELSNFLNEDVSKQSVSARLLLDRFRVVDESSRKSPAYTDDTYISFYFHLSKYIFPKKVIDFTLGLGLNSGVFLMGCKSVESFLGFQEKGEGYYSPRLAVKNIKDNYKKELSIFVDNLNNIENKLNEGWDLAFIDSELEGDKIKYYLDTAWNALNINGLLVIDRLSYGEIKHCFDDFAKGHNRKPIKINSRYGVGIVQK